MNYTNLFKIAGSALMRNKFRTFLTMLGIIIGVASIIALLSIGEGSKKSIQDEMSGMGTNLITVVPGSQQRGGVMMDNSSMQSLELSDVEALRAGTSAISAISPELRSGGQVVYGNMNWPTTLYGANEEYFDIRKIEVAHGRSFNATEIRSLAKVCLLGPTVVENLFGKDTDPIGATIRFNKIPFTVIGVLGEKGSTMGQNQDDLIIAPYTTVQRRILAINHLQSIYISAISEEKTTQAMDDVEAILRNEHRIKESEENDFRIMSQSELMDTFASITGMLTALLGAIAGISLLVGGIGIMNIMYVSVTERTREIGLRMSVGGRGKDILMQFLIESVLLCIIGGIIGILFGLAISKTVGSIMGWPVVIMTQAVSLAFMVCSAIGIFFGWYPARKAAGLNPIDAIRYE